MADDKTLTCPLHEVDTFDPEFLQNPYPFYKRMRQEAPIYRDPKTGIVAISKDTHIREVNRHPKVFTNDFNSMLEAGSTTGITDEERAIQDQGWERVDTMLTADPPVHTRYRKLGMKAFTYKRVLGMDAGLKERANALIDEFISDKKCEFRASFANLLPMYVIMDMLGAPREDFDKFKRWSEAFVVQLDGVSDDATRIKAAEQVLEFQKYFAKKSDEKRKNPTEDVISDLVQADLSEEGDPRKLDTAELLSFFAQIMVAGNESTANQLTDALYQLITHPKQMQDLIDDPSLIENFVEESLRMLSPTNNMWRVPKSDYILDGFEIKAGEPVLLRYGSANRDADKYEDGENFDIHRSNAKEHLAFGYGIHTCIGAQLARRELKIAFEILLSRLKNIRLSLQQSELNYSPNILLRGPTELHIEFD